MVAGLLGKSLSQPAGPMSHRGDPLAMINMAHPLALATAIESMSCRLYLAVMTLSGKGWRDLLVLKWRYATWASQLMATYTSVENSPRCETTGAQKSGTFLRWPDICCKVRRCMRGLYFLCLLSCASATAGELALWGATSTLDELRLKVLFCLVSVGGCGVMDRCPVHE